MNTAPPTLRAAGAVELRRPRGRAWLRLLAIVVSFAHMMDTIGSFSSGAWYALPVAAGMTLLIDLAIWALLEAVIAHGAKASVPALLLLALALLLAVGLNAAYLWRYRPTGMDVWLAGTLTALLALFVPGVIAVTAQLDAADARASTTATDTAREVARLRATLARQEAEAARALTDTAPIRADLDAARAALARQEAEAARLRAEVDAARAGQALDVKTLARAMRDGGMATRSIATLIDRPESTVRGWLSIDT